MLQLLVPRFGFGFQGTWLDHYDVTLPSGREVKGKGVYDLGVFPEFKGNGSVRWALNNYLVGMNVRYIGGFEEYEDGDCTIEDVARRSVDSNTTMDLYASYAFSAHDSLGKTALSLGINNLLDTKPPVIFNGFLGTSDASSYDYMGRYVYLRLTQTL